MALRKEGIHYHGLGRHTLRPQGPPAVYDAQNSKFMREGDTVANSGPNDQQTLASPHAHILYSSSLRAGSPRAADVPG
jgi:hypothetical protein